MKTYIFNTNFTSKDEKKNKLISKQKAFMEKCPGQIVISSGKSLYNYNNQLDYQGPHIKSLCHGLYVEDLTGRIRTDKHFPKTKALFIATMWAEKDIYVVANNSFFSHGTYFNNFLKQESETDIADLYSLDKIYLIYLKGDVRDHVLLENFYVTYISEEDYSIVSYGSLEPENVLKIITGYTYAYSDNPMDIQLLNSVDAGYAIGDFFDLKSLASHVEHTNKFHFINKYIELYMLGE